VRDVLFSLLCLAFSLGLAALALILLVRPPLFLRLFSGSPETNTPTWRVQVRGVSVIFFLFALRLILAYMPESNFMNEFRSDVWIALGIAPFLVPIFLWFVWRFSLREFIRFAQIEGINEDPAWERRMTVLFSAFLLAFIATAFFSRQNTLCTTGLPRRGRSLSLFRRNPKRDMRDHFHINRLSRLRRGFEFPLR
jgi:hypothetical protein